MAGNELWTTDGTPGGTALAKNIAPGDASSEPFDFEPLGTRVVFNASDDAVFSNQEPWITDGTPAGTVKLKEIAPTANEGSFPLGFTTLGGVAYFQATDRNTNFELWRTDGTNAGTQLVADTNPGGASFFPNGFTEFADTLFFHGESENGNELWKLGELAPKLSLKAKAQELAKKLTAEAGCDEDCTVTVKGKVKAKSKKGKKVLAKGKSFKLKASIVEVDAGETEVAAPSFKGKDFKKAMKLLKQGGKLKATLSATAEDWVGNTSTDKTQVKLK